MAELYHFYTVDELGTQRDHWRYTDSKRSIDWGGNTYVQQSIEGDEWNRDLRDQNNKIEVPMEMEPFNKWVASDPGADIRLEIFLHPDGRREFNGRVLGVEFDYSRGVSTVALSATSGIFSGEHPPRTYGPFCDWDVYRRGCFVNVTLYEKFVDMADIEVQQNGKRLVSTAFETKQDNATSAPVNWWSLGYIEKGIERRQITAHDGAAMELLSPLLAPYAGLVRLVPGCNKSIGQCLDKFNNLERYSGYNRVPRKNPSATRL